MAGADVRPPAPRPRSGASGDPGADRRRLLSVAYRMLGTLTDAEDAVQEAHLRLARLPEHERAALREPLAWLTRVTARICLDVLGSARARREQYVGPWLPEPLPASVFGPPPEDPAERAVLDESVSAALLLVLEAATPPERVAFVLHDVFSVPFAEVAEAVGRTPAACRQLASSARARIRSARSRPSARADHAAVVRAFAAAARTGDLRALVAALDPDVVLRSDGGGIVSAARRPVEGAERVARFLLGVLAKEPDTVVVERATLDGPGLVALRGGSVVGVVTADVHGGAISALRIVVNPAKLTAWGDQAAAKSSGSSTRVAAASRNPR